jgi:Rieske Fe-S protein
MRRPDGLHVISRRQFCGAFAGCVGLALGACIDGDGTTVVQTGGLNGPDGENPGSGSGSGVKMDAGLPPADAPSGATCPTSGATDVGPVSMFTTLNKPVYFTTGNFFVVRDANGLYALTARCTHQGVTIEAQTSKFYCPAHGATFDFNGNVTGGPTSTKLVHYAMCTLSNGNLGVVRSQTVPQSQRLVA